MSTQNPEDREFQELLRETPLSLEAPEGLKGRLWAMAAARPVQRTWTPRFAFAAAGAAALAVGAMLMWPTQASAKTLQKVVDATNQAYTFAVTVSQTVQGRMEHVRIAAVGSRIDIQTDKGERVQINAGKISVYDPKENTLTTIGLGSVVGPEMVDQVIREGIGEGLKQVDVKKMVSDFRAQYGERNARISDVFDEDGRQVYTIELQEPKGSSRAKITVDANTDLPVRIQAREPDSDVDMRLEFGGDVEIAPIESMLPKDVKRIDLDLGKLMQQGMAGEGMAKHGFPFAKHGEKPDPRDFEELGRLFEKMGREERRP
jgi:hypothetical protein